MWEHGLDCGHIERRKRNAEAKRIGCTACLNRVEDTAAGVVIEADLVGERLRQERRIQGLVKGSDFAIKLIDVHVEDVDGQAQVKTIRLELERKK